MLTEYAITLDAAATASSALVGNYLGPDHSNPGRRDALTLLHWADLAGSGTVWLNPPYLPSSTLAAFLERAAATALAGVDTLALVPASTGTSWWWRCVVESGAQVEFL